jgi:hypothetical protein
MVILDLNSKHVSMTMWNSDQSIDLEEVTISIVDVFC